MPDYGQMLEEFYRGLLKPGDACVDVGAHVDRHTLPMASCVAPGGRIFAFEPLPTAAGQLRATLAAVPHLGDLVEVNECALSEAADQSEFTFVENNPGYSITGIALDRAGYVAASAQQHYWDYIARPRA